MEARRVKELERNLYTKARITRQLFETSYSLRLSFNKYSQFLMLHDEDISTLPERRVDKFISEPEACSDMKTKPLKAILTRSFRWLY